MVGERLRMLREAKGLTKKQAALELGMPYTTYLHYEDNSNQPNNEVLVKLAIYYQISVDWLLNYTPKSESPPPENKWEALESLLDSLSESEVKEVWSYVKFLHWKRQQERQG